MVGFGLVSPNYNIGSFFYSTPIYSYLFWARSCVRPQGPQSEWKCPRPHEVETAGQDGGGNKEKDGYCHLLVNAREKKQAVEGRRAVEAGSCSYTCGTEGLSNNVTFKQQPKALEFFLSLMYDYVNTVNLRRPESCQAIEMK